MFRSRNYKQHSVSNHLYLRTKLLMYIAEL